MKPVSHLDSYREHATAEAPSVPELTHPWQARLARADGYDLHLVHRWNQAPHVAAFSHRAWALPRWQRRLADHLAGEDVRPLLISWHGRPVIYAELYRAARDAVARCYRARPHDLGLTVAVGELAMTDRGLVRALLPRLTDALFEADPHCTRIVMEPDVRNKRAIKSFEAGGFMAADEIMLSGRVALLMVCKR
ncbi:Protein N-acetyltransferase, RimJ/RimL family [Lentzea xinjiangensis]|uniref:Protein N-acetyltransferase, RimJ/RimL family n=1 Tax=Lentzea xinjiangensis TaxID=402600 RepID=A0A1H9SIG3_9PSEU|nr:GNAT family N-acetyltransferase [Lentzea xinjiangensis]SER84826.1 Protein N-acetyltransferase, RimJ/RimL family [Lentzea xinjiangensis]